MSTASSYRALWIVVFVFGCDRSSDSSPAAAPAPPPARAIGSASSTGGAVTANSTKPGCAHTGLWAVCSVENRLRQAGFVARRVQGQGPDRPGFSVKPIVYTLGRSHLEVFIYPDEASLARDVVKMDTLRVAPIGTAGSWEIPPLLIRSGNLAAVLLSENPRQAERLSLALTAGAPQSGSPR
ncbi:MAG: hypothetical protein ABIW94_02250 [Gemmatimonadaceae bacterium]